MAKPCVCAKCGYPNEPQSELKPARKHKEEKRNPFAERGREKFSELMAEVEEKKRRILKTIGEDEVLMVRFTYTDDNRLKPIIVTEKRKKREEKKKEAAEGKTVEEDYGNGEKKRPMEKMKSVKVNMNMQVSHAYLAAVAVLILLLIALLKRQAQLCSNSGIIATR